MARANFRIIEKAVRGNATFKVEKEKSILGIKYWDTVETFPSEQQARAWVSQESDKHNYTNVINL